jgi:hypothetical protein
MPKATTYRSTVLTSPKPCRKKQNAELSLTRNPYCCCLNVLLAVCYCRFCCSRRGPYSPKPSAHPPQQTLTPGTYDSLACPQTHTIDTMHTQIGGPKDTPCPPCHQHHIHSDVHSTTRAATQAHSLSPEPCAALMRVFQALAERNHHHRARSSALPRAASPATASDIASSLG